MPRFTQPFALSLHELEDIEAFATKNKLDNIARLCAELRVLRQEYLILSQRVGRQQTMVRELEPDPNKRFGKELDAIIKSTPDA